MTYFQVLLSTRSESSTMCRTSHETISSSGDGRRTGREDASGPDRWGRGSWVCSRLILMRTTMRHRTNLKIRTRSRFFGGTLAHLVTDLRCDERRQGSLLTGFPVSCSGSSSHRGTSWRVAEATGGRSLTRRLCATLLRRRGYAS